MVLKRSAAVVFAGLILMACGAPKPTAVTSPAPMPTQSSEPSPTPPSPTPSSSPSPSSPKSAVGSVKCSGGPGTAMVVIGRTFVYDVADTINPRLVCRGEETVVQLVDSN